MFSVQFQSPLYGVLFGGPSGLVWSLLEAPWRASGEAFSARLPCSSNPIRNRKLPSRGRLEGSSVHGWVLSGGDPGDPFLLEVALLSFAPGWELWIYVRMPTFGHLSGGSPFRAMREVCCSIAQARSIFPLLCKICAGDASHGLCFDQFSKWRMIVRSTRK